LANFNNKVKARTARLQGKTRILGTFEAVEAEISGHLSAADTTVSRLFRVEGAVDIQGNLSGEEISVTGGLGIHGDCNAECFKVNGKVKIDGMLNSDVVEAELYGTCRIWEIGGERITIRQGNAFGFRSFLKSIFPELEIGGGLVADLIEGDEIRLEYTTAKMVRGKRIILGPGCDVSTVEYKEAFEAAPDARVGEAKRL
jgi:cytoskeletal protein CcmA (bactofilin family)